MGDPVTALLVGTTALSAGMQIKQGNVAKARAKEVADQRDIETKRQVVELKQKAEERKARNRSIMAAYGSDSQSRSGLALMAENERRDVDNQRAARLTGNSQRRAFLLQGREAQLSAYGNAASTISGTARSLMSGGSGGKVS